jgi:uncharacterized protein YndB with AHSA1/START domain
MMGPGSPIRWRIHLASPPAKVFAALATPEGRAAFWAEAAADTAGVIHFRFPNGATLDSPIVEYDPPRRLAVRYLGSSLAVFDLTATDDGGTDLALTETDVASRDWLDNHAGWLSVLFALKGYVDFGIDLRNHDPARTWDQGFVDN